ncbi:MAG: hypothetical protein JNM57_10870 [Cyclobacteriaceae bacterium]|nr:hypothetical protein [Cyclobacteriaceae bacterium]
MFNSISWQTYLTILVCFGATYYAISAIILYHRELLHLVKGRSAPTSEIRDDKKSTSTVSVIGASKDSLSSQPSNTPVDSDEFILSSSADQFPESIQGTPSSEPANLIIGSVSDLLNELKTLIQLCEEYKSAKEECASLIAASFLKYPHLKETTYQHAISAFVCEESKDHLPFALTLAEVQEWWS